MQYERVLRKQNTLCMPAVWRSDRGMLLYSEDVGTNASFDVPYNWGNAERAKLYLITPEKGLVYQKDIKVKCGKIKMDIEGRTPYYVIPQ